MHALKDMVRIVVIDHQTRAVVRDGRHDRFPVRVGRSAENDVYLDFPFVSTWHAEIRQDAQGGLHLADLGARNGLMVAGRRLAEGESLPLTSELSATVGALELRFHAVTPVDGEITASQPLAPDPRSATSRAAASPRRDDDGALPDLAGLGDAPQRATPGGRGAKTGRHGAIGGELGDALPHLDSEPDPRGLGTRIGRIQALVQRLRPLHQELERARRGWEDALISALRELREAAKDAEAQEHDERMLLRNFPRRDLGGLAGDRRAGGIADVPELSAVAQAASELLPGMRTPSDDDEARRFLARVVDVLRVFAASSLEAQHVRRRQAAEIGTRWEEPADPLVAMETAEDVLRYLLDWRDAGERRSEELVRSFAALVDHIHCYVRASLSAARSLIDSLSPVEIERGAVDRWPTRAAALWRHYQTCFASLRGDSYDNLTPAFRAALGQAYSEALTRAGVPARAREVRERR